MESKKIFLNKYGPLVSFPWNMVKKYVNYVKRHLFQLLKPKWLFSCPDIWYIVFLCIASFLTYIITYKPKREMKIANIWYNFPIRIYTFGALCNVWKTAGPSPAYSSYKLGALLVTIFISFSFLFGHKTFHQWVLQTNFFRRLKHLWRSVAYKHFFNPKIIIMKEIRFITKLLHIVLIKSEYRYIPKNISKILFFILFRIFFSIIY